MPGASARHRVVVVGGGFGGLQVVRKLRRAPVDVTLIDRRNFHLFQPLVYQVAWEADQQISLPSLSSAIAQDGPIDPWVWMPKS